VAQRGGPGVGVCAQCTAGRWTGLPPQSWESAYAAAARAGHTFGVLNGRIHQMRDDDGIRSGENGLSKLDVCLNRVRIPGGVLLYDAIDSSAERQ